MSALPSPTGQGVISRSAAVRRQKWRNRGAVLFFLAPSAVPLLLFTFVPMLSSLWISLHT